MAQDFSLRLITRRAAGGDPIVRERKVKGPELSIGRAGDNDIVLADLSVDPHHARLRIEGPGRLVAESIGGQPFEADGRSVERIDLDASDRPTLVFGAYRLSLAPGGDGGIAVDVTREEIDHTPSPSIFSLRARMFGRRRMAWILGVGILVLCLLIPLFGTGLLRGAKIHPDRQWSTGPLSQAHAFLESDCGACHQKAFVAVRDGACLACHATSGGPAQMARLKDRGSPFRPAAVAEHGVTGLPADAVHKRLRAGSPAPKNIAEAVQAALNHSTDRCASCHVEHTAPLHRAGATNAASNRPEKPTLVVVRDCQACHAQLKMRLSDTRLIDTPDWARHPNFRPQVTRGGDPETPAVRTWVADNPREETGLVFPHDKHVDPTGGAARQAMALGLARPGLSPMTCASCHERDGRGGFRAVEMERHCEACHSLAFTRDATGRLVKLPHETPAKVLAFLHVNYPAQTASLFRNAFLSGGACVDCHAISWSGGAPAVAPVHLAGRFMPRGDFNHDIDQHGARSRDETICRDCHRSAGLKADPHLLATEPWRLSSSASDLMMPDKAQCAACHGNRRAPKADRASADCQECHSFHAPGLATCRPEDRPLAVMRWTASDPPRCVRKARSDPASQTTP